MKIDKKSNSCRCWNDTVQKTSASESYNVMGAARAALEDAGLDYKLVQQAYVGYVYDD